MSNEQPTSKEMVSLSEIKSRFMCDTLAAKEIGRLMEEHAADMDRMEQAAETIERLTLEFQAASQQAAELRDSRAKYMDICEQLSRELDHLKRRHANLQETVRT